MTRIRRSGAVAGSAEGGYVAGELALAVGLLVFPVAMLVLTLPGWAERQSAARAVAREVARTVAVAGTCDLERAREVAGTMATNLGVAEGVEVTLDCPGGARLSRGGAVTARVTVRMPAIQVPAIASVGSWSWTAHHTEPVDRYRSF